MAQSKNFPKKMMKYQLSPTKDILKKFREKLDRNISSDYYGLKSPGLTCYLNSVIQVLFMTEDFREAVKGYHGKDSTTIDPHLARLFCDLQKSVAKTHSITKTLGITNVYEQRDAAEYFEKILCQTSPEAAEMFKGELNHTTTCLTCQESSSFYNCFWILPLTVEESCHQTFCVGKGLKTFFTGQKFSGDNKMYCNRCSKKQDAEFGCEITTPPEILTLLLKRFSFDYKQMCYIKLSCEVDVPQTLYMQKCKYDLYAVVNHFGNLSGGHYTAQIKSFETQAWYNFNDEFVETVRQPLFRTGDTYLRSSMAYLLMYRKVRNTDRSNHKAVFAHSDVDAEGRHVLPRQLNETCNGEKRVMHSDDDDELKGGRVDTFFKRMPNSSGEEAKHLNLRAKKTANSGKNLTHKTESEVAAEVTEGKSKQKRGAYGRENVTGSGELRSAQTSSIDSSSLSYLTTRSQSPNLHRKPNNLKRVTAAAVTKTEKPAWK